MRRPVALAALALAALAAAPAEAQSRRTSDGFLILNVRPRSFLDAGTVVRPGALDNPAGARGQTASYLLSPPYIGQKDRFGGGVLPDPITNAPFVGGRNPFGPLE